MRLKEQNTTTTTTECENNQGKMSKSQEKGK